MIIDLARISKTTVVLSLSGRLDTANAPLLERKIKQASCDNTDLILDFTELTYISSMGLRVLLQAKRKLNEAGRELSFKNINDSVREVFEMTGLLNLMVQEEKFVVIRKEEAQYIVLSLNGQMQIDNIPMMSKELLDIKEQKSYKPITKELILSDELSGILDEKPKASEPFTVILDMDKLTYLSPGASRQLKQTIIETTWSKRILKIHNARGSVLKELEREGLDKLISQSL